jgi:hypothetical protein
MADRTQDEENGSHCPGRRDSDRITGSEPEPVPDTFAGSAARLFAASTASLTRLDDYRQ